MKKWYSKGLKFSCKGSGKCCTSRGDYGFVYMSLVDRQNMAKHFGLKTTEFTIKYCDNIEGVFYLKNHADEPDCIFLTDNKCEVYKARPTQCATWPFWPENLKSKRNWQKEVVGYCPGADQGKLHSEKFISDSVEKQKQSEREIFE